ncbi:MAG: hypothetical protein AAF710_10555 [Planctomycetota bacterium]
MAEVTGTGWTPSLLAGLLFRPVVDPLWVGLLTAGAVGLAGWAWRRGRDGEVGAWTRLALPLRLAGVLGVGLLLMGPSVMPESGEAPTPTPLTILVDASASMQTADVPPPETGPAVSRYGYARSAWLDDARLAALRREHDVRLYSFGPRLSAALPGEDEADHRTSDVLGGVAEAVNLSGGGGHVVVLSDGRHSAGGDAAATARRAAAAGVKVHTVTLGGATRATDLALEARPRQPYLMAGEPGQLDVRLDAVNAAGRGTTLRVRHDGRETARRVSLPAADHAAGGNASLSVELPVQHDEPGLYVYEVSVDALPDEPEANNNAATVFLEVTARRMRVLVLEGRPYWDTKFLSQALRRDERVALKQITQVTPERRERIVTRTEEAGPDASPPEGGSASASGVPETLADWSAYDVVVLGRGMEHVLSVASADALVRYVSEGGGRVVMARGRAYDPGRPGGGALGRAWSVMEPVVWSSSDGQGAGGVLVPTEYGQTHPAFARLMRATDGAPGLASLPTLDEAAAIESLKPGTRVLAGLTAGGTRRFAPRGGLSVGVEGNEDGVETSGGGVVEMGYGRGRVVAVTGQGLWRWSLATGADEDLAGVYDAFWSSLVRWLVMGAEADAGADVSLRLSGRSVELGGVLTVTVVQRGAAEDAELSAEVVGPDGSVTGLSLERRAGAATRRVGAYVPTATGVHTVRLRGLDETPESVVETSGGGKFAVYDGNAERRRTAADPGLMRRLAEGSGGRVLDPREPGALGQLLAAERAARVVPPVPRYVWDRWGWLVLLLGGFGAEWLLRKKGGRW